MSDQRSTRIESKLAKFFERGEVLAAELRADRDRMAAQQREYEIAASPVGDRIASTPIERES